MKKQKSQERGHLGVLVVNLFRNRSFMHAFAASGE